MLIKFMWVKLDIITHAIFTLCYLEPLHIMAQLWHDWDTFDKVAWHHSTGFIMPSEALGTITFTLFVQRAGPIAASFCVIFLYLVCVF